MHANYHTDKAQKMKLVYQYYTNGAGIDVLNCDVGCGPDLKTTHELESKVQHSINDGIVGSKKWTDATEGMWAARPDGPPASKRPSEDPSHCAPPTPWNGAVAGVDRASTLHVVKKVAAATAEPGSTTTTGRRLGCQTCVCGSGQPRRPERPGDLILVTVGDDINEEAAFEALLRDGVTRLGLKGRVLVATTSSKAASAAQSAGGKVGRARRRTRSSRPSRPQKRAAVLYRAQVARRASRPLPGLADAPAGPEDGADPGPERILFRDSDVEVASDGWDDVTAYEPHVVDDPEMDWSRFCHGGRVLTSDPGFALLMPTEEAAKLAGLVFGRIAYQIEPIKRGRTLSTWRSTRRCSCPRTARTSPRASPGSTLNYMCFANSKHVFRFLRKDRRFKDRAEHAPVAVRLSYHPNEPARLGDVYAYYLKGKSGALNGWGATSVGRVKGAAGGSGVGSKACAQSKSLARAGRRRSSKRGAGVETGDEPELVVGRGDAVRVPSPGARCPRRGDPA